MTARIALVAMLLVALIAGVSIYYLQEYAFYSEVPAADVGGVQLVSVSTGQPEPILFENFKAIDSDSSPVRFRACFETPTSLATLTETFAVYDAPVPLNAPRWFGCFDAQAIGAALETGQAVAFLAQKDVSYGVDRVAAILPDGRGFEWNQINACGQVVFNGDPAPEGCPPAPEGQN